MPELLADPNLRLLALVDLLLVLKMILLGNYTSFLRLRRSVFATPEDYALRATTPPVGLDEDIERVRRAHRNDLENILPFFVVSFIFVRTGPSHAALSIYLWGFLIARTLHSIFYIRSMQPHRTVAFTVGAVLMFVMLFRTLVAVV
jgi:glutathione S-transferase